MELVGQIVTHKDLGSGQIKAFSGNYLTVVFEDGNIEKKFAYPSAFGVFLELESKRYNKRIEEDKVEVAEKEAEGKLAREERAAEAQAIHEKAISKGNSKSASTSDTNIAFKCNYCDGGSSKDNVGYMGVCCDEIIKYNTSVAKHVWCKNSQCNAYMGGSLSREDLDALRDGEGFVCYESQMLKQWRAYAGIVQSGVNKGKPMVLRQARVNGLAVLTTRLPTASDDDRFIFAVFLIDESHEGDSKEEGYVSAHPKYRLQLSQPEAEQLKFWDYYFNPKKPEKIVFGSGLHRYLTDTQSAQILKKISEVKTGTSQEELAQEFFEYYCRIKKLDKDRIPTPTGPLTTHQD